MDGGRTVVFLGSKPLGLKCLRKLHSMAPAALKCAITIDDRADRRSVLDGFQAFCRERNIALAVAASSKDAEKTILSVKPDLCIVVGWYWMITAGTLAAVPRGFVGVHNSLLPKYRGGSPLVWAIINGEKTVGVSLFKFTPGMDDGDIWGQKSVEVSEDDYVRDVLDKLEGKAVDLLGEKYHDMLNGPGKPSKQDTSGVSVYPMRKPSDGGVRWTDASSAIYNFIRAQSDPYPGAFTAYGGERLILWRAKPGARSFTAAPGTVVDVTDEGVHVVCGDGRSVVLEQVEYRGSRKRANEVIPSANARLG